MPTTEHERALTRERVLRHRERMAQRGHKRIELVLSPEEVATVAVLRQRHGWRSDTAAVKTLIQMFGADARR
jgi:hypothetical protein